MQRIRPAAILLMLVSTVAAFGLPLGLEPPSVSLHDIRIVDLNPDVQVFAVSLRIKNPNLIDIPVRSLTYQVDLNGEEVAHGARDEPVTLPGLGEKMVEVEAITSFNTLMQELHDMVLSGQLSAAYRLHGNFRFGDGTRPFPFDESGSLDLRELLGIGGSSVAPAKRGRDPI